MSSAVFPDNIDYVGVAFKISEREHFFKEGVWVMGDCIDKTKRASSVSNSNFLYKTEGWRVKDGG